MYTDHYAKNLLLTASQMIECEKKSYNSQRLSEDILMENAGHALANYILSNFPKARNILLFAGPGNNGGDAFVLAKYLLNAHKNIRIISSTPAQIRKNAAKNPAMLFDLIAPNLITIITPNTNFQTLQQELTSFNPEIIIDAIFGTGINDNPKTPYDSLITLFNNLQAYKIAIDIPSGINATTGHAYDPHCTVDLTLALGFPKIASYLPNARAASNDLITLDIGIPIAFAPPKPAATLIDQKYIDTLKIQKRPLNIHKYNIHKIYIFAGAQNMTGAALMAAKAALKNAASIIFVSTSKANPEIGLFLNELISLPTWEHDGSLTPNDYQSLINPQSSIILSGPGLGNNPNAEQLLEKLVNVDAIHIWDADALNILSKHNFQKLPSKLILTPHPAEAARLLNTSTHEILENIPDAANKISIKYNAHTIIKSHATYYLNLSNNAFISPFASPAMAGAGFGDALAGIIAAEIAQIPVTKLTIPQALTLAIHKHAEAAKNAEKIFGNALTPSNLIDHIKLSL